MAGHPLIAYSISAALQSGVFAAVIVSTDSERYAEIARHYGAEVPFTRRSDYSSDTSPDIEWVEYTLKRLIHENRRYDCFSILRPTSPFRLPETIRRAWTEFCVETGVDSLRAIEKCSQHPAKSVGSPWQTHDAVAADRHPLISHGTAASTRLCLKSTSKTPAWRSPGHELYSKGGPSPATR